MVEVFYYPEEGDDNKIMEDEHATECGREEEIAKEDAMGSTTYEVKTKWKLQQRLSPSSMKRKKLQMTTDF